jgi:hypothetical protein
MSTHLRLVPVSGPLTDCLYVKEGKAYADTKQTTIL